jgi:hypothetical protein
VNSAIQETDVIISRNQGKIIPSDEPASTEPAKTFGLSRNTNASNPQEKEKRIIEKDVTLKRKVITDVVEEKKEEP